MALLALKAAQDSFLSITQEKPLDLPATRTVDAVVDWTAGRLD